MNRTGYLALLAFLIVATASGQTPTPATLPTPPPPATLPTPPPPPSGWTADGPQWQPTEPAAVPVAQDGGPTRFWGSVDYFMGWVKGDPLPTLLTTSPAGTPPATAGVLGQTTTTQLYGGARVNEQVRSGVRTTLAMALDDAGTYIIEGGFFVLESASTSFAASSNGSPILAQPFIDVTNGVSAAALLAFPGVSSGSARIVESGRNLWGANLDIREGFFSSSWVRMDAVLGYRSLRYDEHLQIAGTVVPTTGPFATGTSVTSTDAFGSRNIFNGVDLGFRNEFFFQPFSLELYGKVAVGVLNRSEIIQGNTTTVVPGAAPSIASGGVFALSSNIGAHTSHTDTSVPEVGFNFGWDVTSNIRFRVGYSVMWWLDVARAGNIVDTGINPGLIPGGVLAAGTATNRPGLTGTYTDLWVQTINAGLEIRY